MKEPKDFVCLECGRRMTATRAEKIVLGNGRCSCGGCDVDVYIEEEWLAARATVTALINQRVQA